MFSNYAPQAMQQQQPMVEMAPQQIGYQQQLAQALRSQPMAASNAPVDTGNINQMLMQMAMKKQGVPLPGSGGSQPQTPSVFPQPGFLRG